MSEHDEAAAAAPSTGLRRGVRPSSALGPHRRGRTLRTKMLRIDIPSDKPEIFSTVFYGGAAIFSMTPCTEAAAAPGSNARADGARPPPRSPAAADPFELTPTIPTTTPTARGLTMPLFDLRAAWCALTPDQQTALASRPWHYRSASAGRIASRGGHRHSRALRAPDSAHSTSTICHPDPPQEKNPHSGLEFSDSAMPGLRLHRRGLLRRRLRLGDQDLCTSCARRRKIRDEARI